MSAFGVRNSARHCAVLRSCSSAILRAVWMSLYFLRCTKRVRLSVLSQRQTNDKYRPILSYDFYRPTISSDFTSDTKCRSRRVRRLFIKLLFPTCQLICNFSVFDARFHRCSTINMSRLFADRYIFNKNKPTWPISALRLIKIGRLCHRKLIYFYICLPRKSADFYVTRQILSNDKNRLTESSDFIVRLTSALGQLSIELILVVSRPLQMVLEWVCPSLTPVELNWPFVYNDKISCQLTLICGINFHFHFMNQFHLFMLTSIYPSVLHSLHPSPFHSFTLNSKLTFLVNLFPHRSLTVDISGWLPRLMGLFSVFTVFVGVISCFWCGSQN